MLYSHVAWMMLRAFALVRQAGMGLSSDQKARQQVAHIKGDIQIGCLFPIHKKQAGTESCGKIWEQYGIHRTEIALYTVRKINNDTTLLKNITLGIDVRDSCWTERIAMEQTIAFIRDVMADGGRQCCPEKGSGSQDCKERPKSVLGAVIGPGSSATTIAVQNLLQVFRIPQVGYAATSKDLSDKENYKYFMRVVPSDSYQAKAMVEIVKNFGWNYIAVVYSEGNYGEKGFEELQKYIEQEEDICISIDRKINSLDSDDEYFDLLKEIASNQNRPNVVICFCEGTTFQKIFSVTHKYKNQQLHISNETQTLNLSFQWIGSESWGDREDVVKGNEEQAVGSITLRIHSPKVAEFDDYFLAMTPQSNKINPWFDDFWEEKFNCTPRTNATIHSAATAVAPSRGLRSDGRLPICKEGLRLSQKDYNQDSKLSHVMNSIYTVAHAIDRMYSELCKNAQKRGLCEKMRPLNGTLLFQYMMNVTFNDSFGQEIYFDTTGDPPATYDILNYQGPNNKFVRVGSAKAAGADGRMSLSLNTSQMQWYHRGDVGGQPPVSVCSTPCPIGHKREINQAVKCCWTCVKCDETHYLSDLTTCTKCKQGKWPNANRTGCDQLPEHYFTWSNYGAILAMIISTLGMLCTLFTMVVFIRYNATPVVKATTRELSYIILVGFLICYGMTFVIVLRPSVWSCFAVRTLPGVAFAMIYGALLTKTNRIARILAGSKKRILTKKPRFLSTTSQVVITSLLVAVELVIVTSAFMYEWPQATYDTAFLPQKLVLVCQTSNWAFLAPFGWDFFLICLCTLYAVKTRNLPENFNEAKFIGFTMYTTCIIWLAFITIYFGSPYKAVTMCLSFSLSATVSLLLLFSPKLYIIIFQPSKNTRSYGQTAKNIRCNFGSSAINTTIKGAGDERRNYGNNRIELDHPRGSRGALPSAPTGGGGGSVRLTSSGDSGGMSDSDSTIGPIRTAPTDVRRRGPWGDSVHVAIPKSAPRPVQTKAETRRLINTNTEQQRPRLEYELSVIEERESSGLLSSDDLRKTSAVQAGSGLVGSSGSSEFGRHRHVRSVTVQTDTHLLDELFAIWLRNGRASRASTSAGRTSQARQKHLPPKRTSSLYPLTKHKSSKAAKESEEVNDMIAAYRRHQQGKVKESAGSQTTLISKQDGSDEEFLKLLDRPVVLSSPDQSIGDGYDDEFGPDEDDSVAHLQTILADTINNSMKTMVGTAVHFEEPVGDSSCSESLNSSSSAVAPTHLSGAQQSRMLQHRVSVVAESVEKGLDMLVPTALRTIEPREAKASTSSYTTPPPSPKAVVELAGPRGSTCSSSAADSPPALSTVPRVLNRIGVSIKRRMKRSPNSSQTDLSSSANVDTVSPLATMMEKREAAEPLLLKSTRETSDGGDSGIGGGMSKQGSTERTTDSGIGCSPFTTSSEGKGSSVQSSLSSKHGGSAKSHVTPQNIPESALDGLDEATVLPLTPTAMVEQEQKVGGHASDDSAPARNGDNKEFMELFTSQGLQPTNLSPSTLV